MRYFSIRHLLPHFCLYSHLVVIFVGSYALVFCERIFYLSENGDGYLLTGAPPFLQGGLPSGLNFPQNSDETEDLQVKYAPKKVFIIKDGGYQELTYEAYCALCESDSSYKDKRFIPLHGMLMEVTEDDFKEFYRNQRRQKYLEERSINNQDISIDMLPTQEFRDRDVLFDSDQDVAEKVLNNIFLDKLREVLPLLDAEDQKLLWLRHGQELSEQKLGEIYGVSQQAISKRLRKLYDKIKKMIEI